MALIVRALGTLAYEPAWRAMQAFTAARTDTTDDEIWLLQHPPIFTLGQAGKAEHVLAPGAIPVIHIDRGGQVTYHGPGQWVAYVLCDLRRLGIGVRALVDAIERAVVALLAGHGIAAAPRRDAPGVYVDGAKIAALGLRVRRGCSYHGVSFNVSMDLEPFARINPCGYPGMAVTQLFDLLPPGARPSFDRAGMQLAEELARQLGYNRYSVQTDSPVVLP